MGVPYLVKICTRQVLTIALVILYAHGGHWQQECFGSAAPMSRSQLVLLRHRTGLFGALGNVSRDRSISRNLAEPIGPARAHPAQVPSTILTMS